jgi:DNA-binding ferritin-like protein
MPDEARVWEGINDIRERTTRIETEVRGINSQISERCRVREERLAKIEDRQDRLETDTQARIREMEKRQWMFVGASSVVTALTMTVLPILLRKVIG